MQNVSVYIDISRELGWMEFFSQRRHYFNTELFSQHQMDSVFSDSAVHIESSQLSLK